MFDHVVKLVRAARPGQPDSPSWVKEMVMWGPGPRALQYLVLGAKARAVLRGSSCQQSGDSSHASGARGANPGPGFVCFAVRGG